MPGLRLTSSDHFRLCYDAESCDVRQWLMTNLQNLMSSPLHCTFPIEHQELDKHRVGQLRQGNRAAGSSLAQIGSTHQRTKHTVHNFVRFIPFMRVMMSSSFRMRREALRWAMVTLGSATPAADRLGLKSWSGQLPLRRS